jgi:tight adherence protein C
MNFMVILIDLLLIVSSTLIIIGIFLFRQPELKPIRLDSKESYSVPVKKRNLFIENIFPFSQQIIDKLNLEDKIRNRLNAAHLAISPKAFINIKLLAMGVCLILSIFAIEQRSPGLVSFSLVIGYFLPDLWVNLKISRRKKEITYVFPETVDLIGLCVEAGLDFTASVQWIADKKIFNNPLMEELIFVLEEIKWGKPRIQALKDMSARVSIPEVKSLVYTLVQAEKMGTPVSEAFNALSEDTRLMRFRRGERFAAKAPIKILIPLIFCILPVIGIVIGGPILLQFMQGNMFKGL